MKHLFALFLCSALSLAAADSPATFYKLDFNIRELESGKQIDSRTYSLRLPANQNSPLAQIRINSKVPVPTNPEGTQYSYYDIFTNFDINHFKENGGEISLEVISEFSAITLTNDDSKVPKATVRLNKWNSTVSAKVGKTTQIFSSDDVSSKRQMTVELTATAIR